MKRCIGHGTLGEIESRNGHDVAANLMSSVFSPKSTGYNLWRERCDRCESISYHYRRHTFIDKGRNWIKSHATRWVEKGKYPTVGDAKEVMEICGITPEAIAVTIVEFGMDEDCPGYCFEIVDGDIAMHRITEASNMHIDVMDPDAPLTISNIIGLCESCNRAKGSMKFSEFVARRMATLQAMKDHLANGSGEQLELV